MRAPFPWRCALVLGLSGPAAAASAAAAAAAAQHPGGGTSSTHRPTELGS